jgi:hypothetical protein
MVHPWKEVRVNRTFALIKDSALELTELEAFIGLAAVPSHDLIHPILGRQSHLRHNQGIQGCNGLGAHGLASARSPCIVQALGNAAQRDRDRILGVTGLVHLNLRAGNGRPPQRMDVGKPSWEKDVRDAPGLGDLTVEDTDDVKAVPGRIGAGNA